MQTKLKTTHLIISACVWALAITAVEGGLFREDPVGPGFPTESKSLNKRVGTWEFYLSGTLFTAPDLVAKDVSFPDRGTNDAIMSISDSEIFGLGFGYNLSERVNINGELNYGSADYGMAWGNYRLAGSANLFNSRMNVDINLFTGSFTPFITGGIGYTRFDSGIPTGEVDFTCWWDYYWGVYVCNANVQTHSSDQFTWNAGVGLRWDINDLFFMKFLYDMMWMEIGTSGTEAFPQYQLVGGFKF